MQELLGLPLVWPLVTAMPFLEGYIISVQAEYFFWLTIFGNLPLRL